MNPLDYRRDGESVRDCIDRYERCTGRDYGQFQAASFDAAVANAPCKLHPTSHDLPRRTADPMRDGYTLQDIRNEQNRECESYLVPVECAWCGDTYYHDDAPDGEWFCDLCTISEMS